MVNSSAVFTSSRERRLWLWVLVTMVAIYATLGPARLVVDELRERNLLRISFALLIAFILVAVIHHWVKTRPGWREIGVGLGVAFAYWVAFIRMNSPEERTHLVEYGVVAALIHMALLERARNGGGVRAPAAVAVMLTAGLGLLDEMIQALIPGRVFDVRDIGFNAFAGFMIVVARLAMAEQKRPGWRVWFLWLMAGSIGWGSGESMDNVFVNAGLAPLYGRVVVGGAFAGLLQWLVLRSHLVRASRWLLATLGATAITGIPIFVLGTLDPVAGWFAAVSIFGLVAGTLQWLILRQTAARAGWWVWASTAGWIIGMPLGMDVGPPALGAAYGAITGCVLVWLLRDDTTRVDG